MFVAGHEALFCIIYRILWSRRWESDPQPNAYDALALPLSYFGIILWYVKIKLNIPGISLSSTLPTIVFYKLCLKKATSLICAFRIFFVCSNLISKLDYM